MALSGVRLVPGTTDEDIARARAAVPHELARLVRGVMIPLLSDVKTTAPVGATAVLRRGYALEPASGARRTLAGGFRGALVNPTLYHDIRMEGRRAGRRPPTAALIPWVGSKLGIPPGPERRQVAFLVARKIGRRGYAGSETVDKAFRRRLPQLRRDASKLGLRVVRAMR